MNSSDPMRTVHFKIAEALDTLLGRLGSAADAGLPQPGLESDVSDDPRRRGAYDITLNAAWALLAVACGGAMLVLGVPARALFGATAGNVVLDICLAAVFFCLAG